MKILIACEFSGTVRNAFRNLGYNAWSCDLKPSLDGSAFHIQDDVLEVLKYESWDLMIAHPPCTYLSVAGARWFKGEGRLELQNNAVEFFRALAGCSIRHIALENPVSIMSTRYRKPDQIIQPWQFGDEFTKRTCLWLKNLPKLEPTKIVGKGEFYVSPSGKRMPAWYNLPESKARSDIRSKTFPGIAEAMGSQWGKYLENT